MMKKIETHRFLIFFIGISSFLLNGQSLDKNFTAELIPKGAMSPHQVNSIVGSSARKSEININSPVSDRDFEANKVITLSPGAKLTGDVSLKIKALSVTDNTFLSTIVYYDGLGRQIQNVAVKRNPDGKDIVGYHKYDQFGRNEKTYLPFPTNQNTGGFINDPIPQINSYYQTKYGDSNPYSQQRFDNSPLSRVLESASPGNAWALLPNSDNDRTTKFAYETNLDNEVLHFNLKHNIGISMHFYYAAGELQKSIVKSENWKSADGKLNTSEAFVDKNGRTVADVRYKRTGSTIEKLVTYNVYDDYGRLRYLIPPKATKLLTPILTSQRYSNTEKVTIPKEDFTFTNRGSVRGEGSITYQILNNRLKIVVSGSFDSPSLSILGLRNTTRVQQSNTIATLPITSDFPDMQFGNLTTSPLPDLVSIGVKEGKLTLKDNNNYVYITNVNGTFYSPILFKNLASSSQVKTILNKLAFRYEYDEYNREVAKKTPGKGWEYIVYDQLDRQILVQDANLREKNQWLFTKYDAYGRSIYSGKFTSSKSRVQLQADLDAFIANNTNKANIENRIGGTVNVGNVAISYSNNAFPNTGITELLTVSYYDDYNFVDTSKPAMPSSIDGQVVTQRTKGLPTSIWVKTLGANTWSKSYTYYDERGRAIQSYDKNHQGGHTISNSKLDFRGNVQKAVTTHKKVSSAPLLTITDRFEYDTALRLKGQYQKINNQPEELLSEIKYDALGNSEGRKVGGLASSNIALQDISYTYNIRGWMKEVNDVEHLGNSLFAYKLNYNDPLEGNGITNASRLYNGNIAQSIWKSQHDNIKQSYVYNYDALNQLKDASYLSGNTLARPPNGRLEVHNINYDANGNISGLSRYGLNGVGNSGSTSNKPHDVLNYNYEADSNVLLSVTDTGDKTKGFVDGNASGNDYVYDKNGNLIKDLNKGISEIEYNYLDLVQKITFTNGKSISFTYDASGRKLSKVYVSGGNTTKTEYLGGFQYQQNELQFFPTAEGYASKEAGNTFKYNYVYADHLGNNRLSYSDTNNDGSISTNEILSNSNYYPMGGILEGDFNSAIASNYNYKFQGKELQLDNNVRLFDFGSRMYDPTLGRWFNTDPQNQYNSPYVALGNNYIITVDPDGEWVHIAIGAVAGGLINLAVNWDNIDNFGEGLAAFGTGALAGGLTAACGGCSAGAIAAIGVGTGALTSATNAIVAQTGNGVGLGDVQWGAVGQSAFIGAIAGGASSIASSYATNTLSSPLINNLKIASPLLSDAINGTVAGAAGGFVGGGVGGFISEGTFDGAIRGSLDGLKSGAIIGLGTSVGLSYVNAKLNHINPITGKSNEVKKDFTQKTNFWKEATTFRGVKVFQRNDIFDPNTVSSWKVKGVTVTGTNIERMSHGLAPIGIDGKSVNIHHMLQSATGSMAEMTQTFHKSNHSTIHINPNTIPSGINRSQFNQWRTDYWKNRATGF